MDLWGSWRGMEGIGGKKGSKTIYSYVFNFNNFQKGSIEQQQHPVQDCLVYLGNPNHCVECLLLCPWHLLPRLFIQTFEEAITTFYSSFVCIAFSQTCIRNSLGGFCMSPLYSAALRVPKLSETGLCFISWRRRKVMVWSNSSLKT